MSGSAGQVALVEGTAKITGSTDAGVRDYVAYSGLSSSTSAARLSPCTDTDAASDFKAGAPTPQNTGAAPVNCVTPQ